MALYKAKYQGQVRATRDGKYRKKSDGSHVLLTVWHDTCRRAYEGPNVPVG